VAGLKIAILTCSDTRTAAEDTAGRALIELAENEGHSVVAYEVVPDNRAVIAETLVRMADVDEADVVFTCGGTGLSPRDVTPEATRDVSERLVPGIAEYLRAESLRVTPRAMLARGTAVQRGTTLIINFPGSEKAARESFGFIASQLGHAAEMARGGGHS
jgi:molybdenum cofactor synthesis domain-containing protein